MGMAFFEELMQGNPPVRAAYLKPRQVPINIKSLLWLLRYDSEEEGGTLTRAFEIVKFPDTKPVHAFRLAGLPYLSPDGKHMVLGSSRSIKVYDVEKGKLSDSIPTHKDCLWQTTFSPDGTCILLWEKPNNNDLTGENRLILLAGEKPVITAKLSQAGEEFSDFNAFSPKGELVRASVLSDSLVRLCLCEIDSEEFPNNL